MTIEDAVEIISKANASEPMLSNMIRALSCLKLLNTDEDEKRLEAALFVRNYKRKRNVKRQRLQSHHSPRTPRS